MNRDSAFECTFLIAGITIPYRQSGLSFTGAYDARQSHGALRMALSRRHLSILIAASALAVGIAWSAAAGEPRLALQGHDPVAYFTMAKPTKGVDEWSYVYDETRYLFATAKHREMFITNPDKYAPMYNGYCARGMVKGRKFEPNPENWAIVDGKLFVASGPSGAGPLVMDKGQIVEGKAQWEIVRKEEK